MTDKEKFRKGVERLKSNLIYGACSSQVAMETRCKDEAYDDVLAILDSLQEEPVSTRDKLRALSDGKQHIGWLDDAREVEEESISEDLGDYINKLSKQFPEVSFAKLSRIAVRVAKWQKEQMMTKAFPAEIDSSRSDGRCILGGNFARFETGEMVKVIVIKEG